MRRRTIQLELVKRAGKRPAVSAVLSTEAPVARRDYDGQFFEVLSHKADAVDLSRAPLPLIAAHDHSGLPVGIVDNVRTTDGKLRGQVTFGASERAQEIAADVEAGVIRNLSVGYSIERFRTAHDGDTRTIIATRWTPHEVSVVAVPADAGAGFGRSQNMGKANKKRIEELEAELAELRAEDAEADEGADAEADDTGDDAHDGSDRALTDALRTRAERQRCVGILRWASTIGIADAERVANDLIARGVPLAAARGQILKRKEAEQHEYLPLPYSIDIDSGRRRAEHVRSSDVDQDFRGAAVDALLLRAGVHVPKPHPAARDVTPSVLDIARTCLSRVGKSTRGMSNERLVRYAMTTSDFPLILGDSVHQAARRGYEDEPSSHRAWVRVQPVEDFHDQLRVILGSAPDLELVGESAEYKSGPLDEDATTGYRIGKYGKIVDLTWEVLVNDHLSQFMRIQPAMGQAARRKESDVVYGLLAENTYAGPTMQDGVALFHANHANLADAGAMDAATLGAARGLLRKQTAFGGGYMNLAPKFLIVPTELEQDADTLLAASTRVISATLDSDRPQWLGRLQLVVEPRLPADAFYLAADPTQIDTVELGVLEENMSGPMVERNDNEGWRRDIISWKVRHAFGAKVLDWRGLVRVPIAP